MPRNKAFISAYVARSRALMKKGFLNLSVECRRRGRKGSVATTWALRSLIPGGNSFLIRVHHALDIETLTGKLSGGQDWVKEGNTGKLVDPKWLSWYDIVLKRAPEGQ